MVKTCICIVAFNREAELARLLQNLQSVVISGTVDLIISIDSSPVQPDIVNVTTGFSWPHGDYSVVIREHNLGLKKHVLSCLEFSLNYDVLVLLEDDILISVDTLNYIEASFNVLKYANNVAAFSLYSYGKNEDNKHPFSPLIDSFDNYFIQFPSSWGFGITPSQYIEFKSWFESNDCDFFEDNLVPSYVAKWSKNSWKKHFVRYLVSNNKYVSFPRFSLSSNPGSNGTHHVGIDSLFSVPICQSVRNWDIGDTNNSQSIYDVNFLRESLDGGESLVDDGSFSVDISIQESKSKFVVTNFYFSLSDYISFNFYYWKKLIRRILFKLRACL